MKNLRNIYLLAILVMLGLAFVSSQPVFADEDEQDEIVTLEQLPAAVRKTLQRESSGGTLGEIDKEVRHGRITYEAEVVLDGKEYEVRITGDGVLLGKELEEEEEHECRGRRKVWWFEEGKLGSIPKGWKVAETSGEGKLATWKVITDKAAPSGSKVVAITQNSNRGHTYNLLMATGTSYKDLEIGVKVKAGTGEQDQGGGPIWRAKDRDNYYLARWNPLEDNFRVYYVKEGKRTQLASATVKLDPRSWHEIEIKHVGNRIVAELDDEKLIELEDDTFTEAGMIGLWTKADAAT